MRRGFVVSLVLTIVISAASLIAVVAAGWSPLLGLDLQGGISVVYKPAHPVNQATLDETINIIRNRVDALGVAQPNIASQAGNIVVQLPGVKDRARALAVIGQTAKLYFRPVLCAEPMPTPGKPLVQLKGQPSCNSSVNYATVASTPPSLDRPDRTVLLPARDPLTGKLSARYILGPSQMSGRALKTATAQFDPTQVQWVVNFTLTSSGSPLFDHIAQIDYQHNLGIVLDGVVESAPTINSTSFGGHGSITGRYTAAQAKNLALILRYGSLPVQLNQQTVQSVSPTLGSAALRAGILAGLAGLALVMAYAIFYYRALGIVVLGGLATTAALLYAIISVLSHTAGLALDLSGVTGLIVSVGVTVDSYIVYFERLKDEVRGGNTVRASIDRSFSKAFRTVVAADLVSLIGAVVLSLLAIGQVRGFALFLGMSTLLDVITAWVFTRPAVMLLGRSKLFTEARWVGVARGLGAGAHA